MFLLLEEVCAVSPKTQINIFLSVGRLVWEYIPIWWHDLTQRTNWCIWKQLFLKIMTLVVNFHSRNLFLHRRQHASTIYVHWQHSNPSLLHMHKVYFIQGSLGPEHQSCLVQFRQRSVTSGSRVTKASNHFFFFQLNINTNGYFCIILA